MTSVGYLSQPTLEEFGPQPETDPRPETCWRTNSDGGWVDSRWLYEALIKGDVFLADDWLQETFLDYVEKQVCIEFACGLAFWPEGENSFQAVLRQADTAMYRDKKTLSEGTP